MATRQSTPKLKTPLTHSVNNTVASSIETHALATPIINQETNNFREEITTELITPIIEQEVSTLRQAIVTTPIMPMLLPSVNGTYADPYDPNSIRFINNKCVYTCTGLCCAFDSALAPYQTQLLLSPVNINGTLATTVEQALHMINTARTQVNADWNASSGVTAICNKPVLASVATLGTYNSLIDKPNLAEVACSGCYCDLCGLPTIPPAQVNSDWLATEGAALICNKPSLSCVACSGDYNDLLNTPDLCLIQQQSDWAQADSNCPTYIKNKPELARVATSGLYADLLGAPSIPEQVNSDWLALSGPAYICNKPSLSEVALSGDYNDLRNIPPDTSKTYTFSFDESTHKLAITEHGLFGDTVIFNDTIDTAYSFEYEGNTLIITDNRNNTYTISLGTDFYTKCEVNDLISAITDLIPEQASPTNQLADKNFVNSSIATNTANFCGTFNNLACLCATAATPNDYAFYAHCDTCGNCVYDRYKYNASCVWVCEYTLNNSSFTANQWAAINSGITDTAVAKITDVYNCTVQLCNADGTTLLGSFTLNQNQNTCICLAVGGGTVTGIDVYCGTTCICTIDDSTSLCLSSNAFNTYAQINTSTYPGACCTGTLVASDLNGYATCSWVTGKGYTTCKGTVTQVKIGTADYNPSSGIVTLPAYPPDLSSCAGLNCTGNVDASSLATVATSGKYCDLTGTPTIPAAANNGKITLCVNSTCICSFTVNQSTNTNITLPAYPPDLSSCPGLNCTGTLVPSDLNGYATETWVTNKNYCTHDCLVKLSFLCSNADRRILFSAQENGCICPVYASNGVPFTYNACYGCLKIGDFSCECCHQLTLRPNNGLMHSGPKGAQNNLGFVYIENNCLDNCSIGVAVGSGNVNRGIFDYYKASETATSPTFRWLQYWDSKKEIHSLPIWGELGANNKVVYSCVLTAPSNTRRYVLVCFDKTCCGNPSTSSACFEIDIYTSKYFIWTDTCTIRSYWVTNGLDPNASSYGSFCYGTPYTCNSSCFWITYSNYRQPVIKGARKVTILCTTTTAPEGITFCAPTNRNSYIDVYCGTTCIGTLQGPSSLCLGCNAFSNEAFTTCTGTVTILDAVKANSNVPVALCTGNTSVGKSASCGLNFNTCTGVLTAASFSGDVSGHASTADSSTYADCALVSLTNKDSSRPTDANCEGFIDGNHRGAMNIFLATSCMTSNKPTNDSYITQWNWDSCCYKAQMAIPTNPANTIQMRFKYAGTWCAWNSMGCYIGTVKNSTCFGGCTYSQACTDIRSGLCDHDCLVKVVAVSSNADRNILMMGGGFVCGCVCPVYFNNVSGKALTYNACCGLLKIGPIAGCTSSVTGSSGAAVGLGYMELSASTPFIDFHRNNACQDYSSRIIDATNGLCITVNNATGCTASTTSCTFCFLPTGVFKSPYDICSLYIRASTAIEALSFYNMTSAHETQPASAACCPNITFILRCRYNCGTSASPVWTNCERCILMCGSDGSIRATSFVNCNGCTMTSCIGDVVQADIANFITDISVNVYCGTTCKCTLCKASSLCLGSNAFNSTAFTTCTGTVTVSDNNGSTALPIALCTGAKSIGKSSACSLTFTPSTGTLCVDVFDSFDICANTVTQYANGSVAINTGNTQQSNYVYIGSIYTCIIYGRRYTDTLTPHIFCIYYNDYDVDSQEYKYGVELLCLSIYTYKDNTGPKIHAKATQFTNNSASYGIHGVYLEQYDNWYLLYIKTVTNTPSTLTVKHNLPQYMWHDYDTGSVDDKYYYSVLECMYVLQDLGYTLNICTKRACNKIYDTYENKCNCTLVCIPNLCIDCINITCALTTTCDITAHAMRSCRFYATYTCNILAANLVCFSYSASQTGQYQCSGGTWSLLCAFTRNNTAHFYICSTCNISCNAWVSGYICAKNYLTSGPNFLCCFADGIIQDVSYNVVRNCCDGLLQFKYICSTGSKICFCFTPYIKCSTVCICCPLIHIWTTFCSHMCIV